MTRMVNGLSRNQKNWLTKANTKVKKIPRNHARKVFVGREGSSVGGTEARTSRIGCRKEEGGKGLRVRDLFRSLGNERKSAHQLTYRVINFI